MDTITMRDAVNDLHSVLNYGHHHDGNPFIAPNMKEIDQFDLACTNFSCYNPDHQGYASFKVGKYSQGSHYLLYWDGTGIFYFRDWDNHKMKVRYNEYRCKKCGYLNRIDSSD